MTPGGVMLRVSQGVLALLGAALIVVNAALLVARLHERIALPLLLCGVAIEVGLFYWLRSARHAR